MVLQTVVCIGSLCPAESSLYLFQAAATVYQPRAGALKKKKSRLELANKIAWRVLVNRVRTHVGVYFSSLCTLMWSAQGS